MRTYFLTENFKNFRKLENEEVENILKYFLNLRIRTFHSLEHTCKHWTVWLLQYDSSTNSSVTMSLLILPLKLLFLTMQAGAKDTWRDSVSHPDTVCFLFPHFLQQCFSSNGLFRLHCLSNPWVLLSGPAKEYLALSLWSDLEVPQQSITQWTSSFSIIPLFPIYGSYLSLPFSSHILDTCLCLQRA